jgi:lipopolysaccharide export system protein LptA
MPTVVVCLFPLALKALPSDDKVLMYITADTSQYNYKVGETWFEGHVVLDQGTTHLRADRLITKKDAHNRIQLATAYGTEPLAHYWTQPKPGEKELHAYAKIIKFYPLEARTQLEGDVTVTQGNNHFQGQIVVYYIKQQTISVPPTKNSRATFVIDADHLKQVL